jgi:hypothetical protein
VSTVEVEVENAGTIAWRNSINVSYHWLDDRDNPIVWDGYRTPAPPLGPGQRATVPIDVRAPLPPGRYRLAFDMVAEGRAWFSELGGAMQRQDLEVTARAVDLRVELPEGLEPAPDWEERVRAAHREGYGVVAGAIDWTGGLMRPRPGALEAYAPGPGRIPGFTGALIAPSVLPGVQLQRVADVAGLPAYAAPAPRQEPWVYDGRIVLRARPRSGRPSG